MTGPIYKLPVDLQEITEINLAFVEYKEKHPEPNKTIIHLHKKVKLLLGIACAEKCAYKSRSKFRKLTGYDPDISDPLDFLEYSEKDTE